MYRRHRSRRGKVGKPGGFSEAKRVKPRAVGE